MRKTVFRSYYEDRRSVTVVQKNYLQQQQAKQPPVREVKHLVSGYSLIDLSQIEHLMKSNTWLNIVFRYSRFST